MDKDRILKILHDPVYSALVTIIIAIPALIALGFGTSWGALAAIVVLLAILTLFVVFLSRTKQAKAARQAVANVFRHALHPSLIVASLLSLGSWFSSTVQFRPFQPISSWTSWQYIYAGAQIVACGFLVRFLFVEPWLRYRRLQDSLTQLANKIQEMADQFRAATDRTSALSDQLSETEQKAISRLNRLEQGSQALDKELVKVGAELVQLKGRTNSTDDKLAQVADMLKQHLSLIANLQGQIAMINEGQTTIVNLIQELGLLTDKSFSDDFSHGLVNWEVDGLWKVVKEDDEYILVVTNADHGGIARPCRLWNDYRFEFDTKIVSSNTTWIIRAESLAKYVMLQCGRTELIPHYRIEQEFIVLKSVRLPVLLPLHEWFHVDISVTGSKVIVKAVLNGKIEVLYENDNDLLRPHKIPAPFSAKRASMTEYYMADFPLGSIGFRASGNTECAHFRNVRVTKT